MNKFVTLFAAACVLLGSAACKKDKVTKTCRLSGRANYADSVVITYDAQGRVAVYDMVNLSTYTFTYSGLSAQCNVSTPTDPNAETYNIYLNSDGTVASFSNSIPFSGSTLDYTYAFKYNNEGRIRICEQRVDGPGAISIKMDSMVYLNGCLIRQYTFYATSSTGPYTLQEYSITNYSDVPNALGYHVFSLYEEPITMVSGFYPFYHLFGKGSDKLPTETNFYTNTGTLQSRMNYNYLYDADGKVLEVNKARSILAPQTENLRFYYNCE